MNERSEADEAASRSVLIVDDETPARLLLRELLGGLPGWRIVGEAKNGLEAVQRVKELAPDLVLLDVQMPKLDGFEVLELLGPGVAVIFTTAYDQYALRAFEVNAVDYLLKPFSPERFEQALGRAASRLTGGTAKQGGVTAAEGEPTARTLARAARAPGAYLERLVIRDGAKVEIIPVAQIDYVQGRDDYLEVFCGSRSSLKQQTLQSLAEDLDPQRFVRIHRSYMLNLDRLARVEPYGRDSKVAVLKDGRQLPVSRSGEARLREILGS